MYLLASLFQLDYLLKVLVTPAGVGLAMMVILMFLFSFGRQGRWVVLTITLFCSTLSFDERALRNPLIFPLQDMRLSAEPLTLTLLLFLFLPSLLASATPLRRPLLGVTFAFWTLELLYSLRWAAAIETQHGVLSIFIFTAIVFVLGFGLPRWFRGIQDVYLVVRCLGVVAVLFLLGTVAQLAVNKGAIMAGNRLCALTGSPQHAAFMLAIFIVPLCFLVCSNRESTAMRSVWIAAAALSIVMLMWTGSRTGVLTGLVGVGLLFRRRLGQFFGFGFIAAILVFFFLSIFQVSPEQRSRILSTGDTRTGVWARQISYFAANPLLGSMSENDSGSGENSYLTVAAHTGIVGLGLLMLMVGLTALGILRLRRLRPALQSNEDRLILDWIPAGLIAIFVGAFFEGVLVGTLTFMVLSVYIYLGVLKFLTDANTIERIEQQAALDLEHANHGKYPDPYYQHPNEFLGYLPHVQ